MYEKQGYLNEKCRLFYLCDVSDKVYDYHYHDFYKIIFFLKGDVTYNIEGKNYILSPYDVVFVGKNEIHRPIISSEETYERYVLYISSSLFYEDIRYRICFDKACESHINVTRLNVNDTGMVYELLKGIVARYNADAVFKDLYLRLDVLKILLIINESILQNGVDYQGNVQFNSKIIEVCEYINNHLKEDLSTAKLAEIFYISKYYFMHQFKAQTGISVHQYVLEKRIQYVNSLVESGEKVTIACLNAGFNDYSTYLKASKRKLLKKDKD